MAALVCLDHYLLLVLSVVAVVAVDPPLPRWPVLVALEAVVMEARGRWRHGTVRQVLQILVVVVVAGARALLIPLAGTVGLVVLVPFLFVIQMPLLLLQLLEIHQHQHNQDITFIVGTPVQGQLHSIKEVINNGTFCRIRSK